MIGTEQPLTSPAAEPRPHRLATRHWVFIGSMVALDFAVGQFSKSLLHASGVGHFVRLDMFLPVTLWMLTRLVVDRFGVLMGYQLAWGVLACFALGGSMLPGPLMLLVALTQGLTHDLFFSIFRRLPRSRVFISAILGGVVAKTLTMGLRVLVLGLPWTNVTQTLLGIQTATSLILDATAAAVALGIWHRIRNLHITRMLQVQS